MVIDMNEARLCTIEQIEQFLEARTQSEFSASGNGRDHYDHISGVLKHLD